MKQGGFSLVEALIALAVVMGIASVLLVYSRDATDGKRALEFTMDIQRITDTLHRLYPATSPDGYKNLTGVQVTANVAPAIPDVGGLMSNPFGGNYAIAPTAWRGEQNAAALIIANNIPAALCPALVAQIKDRVNMLTVNTSSNIIKDGVSIDLAPADYFNACKASPPSPNSTTFFMVIL
ncbi:MAG TPA: type 4 pilus major pilin [Rhodanobacteraceae bacterium]|nr:type 4 pilus major pilin [Rhodanobacteraceae bacterium]